MKSDHVSWIGDELNKVRGHGVNEMRGSENCITLKVLHATVKS
jgi:3-deoxy-D-arabino-heptulosonate 7-phosphate (DAHP) synthase class II